MTQVHAIYTPDNIVQSFCAADMSEQERLLCAQNFSGAAISTNTIESPSPNADFSNLLYPHHVSVTGGVASILTGSAKDAASTSEQARVELEELRQERNKLIAATDWWANSDLTMTAEQTAYRQALRNITDTYTSVDDVVWPTKP